MKEIGGYFELEKLINNTYYPNAIALNTARHALLYLIKARKISKLYVPSFLCDAITKMCERNNYVYEYYNIDANFMPMFSGNLQNDEYLYIVNYYGQINHEIVRKLRSKYKNIILDNVQAFFQEPMEGIDTIYSCRKFFGVPDGAYLATDVHLGEKIEKDLSKKRMGHLLGRFEGVASDYYKIYKENDASFNNENIHLMSALTENILGAIDYNHVMECRNANYLFLEDKLGNINKKKFKMPKGPFCYPLYCKNGVDVRRKLAEKRIYVATLWPNVFELGNDLEKDFAENILPLPCDQRYDERDMEVIVKELKTYMLKI